MLFGFGRLIRRWADQDMRRRLQESRQEVERLEAVVKIQEDQIKRLAQWQARETARLNAETAILVTRQELALEARRHGDVDPGAVGE